MRAQALQHYGDADAFEVIDLATPEPGEGEIRMRIEFFAVNGMDFKLRSGSLKEQRPLRFPAVLGYEAAGTVDSLGSGATGLSIGDQVTGFTKSGAYAEFAVTRADQVALVPPGLDLARAAAVPSAAETAQRIIRLIDPQPGDTVVVNGAGGGVGTLAVQLLVSVGARVIGTCSPANSEYVSSLGADPTAYGDGVVARIHDLAPRGVDAVLDLGGHDFIDAALQLDVDPARIVTIVDFGAASRGVTVSGGDVDGIAEKDFSAVLDHVASGELSVEIAEIFEFDDVGSAQRMSESGHVRGKILVRTGQVD